MPNNIQINNPAPIVVQVQQIKKTEVSQPSFFTNTSIAISASQINSGTLPIARGGTGQSTITVNGSLLIANTVSGGYDVNPLTPGTGIAITNDKGSILIAATGASATDQYARDHSNGAFDTANGAFTKANAAYANANTALYTAGQVRANLSNTAPINYDPSTGIFSHALSGATASGYGDAATVAKIVVDSNGHITSVTNTAIAIAASQITSGTLSVTRGGTGQTAITVNGSLLIGNTVSGGFDVNTIAQSAPVIVTNDKGIVTLSHARSGVTATTYGTASQVPVLSVDANGHITSVTNTTITGIDASAVTTGILAVAHGGTGKDATGLANGKLLIGNTVNSGFDLASITSGGSLTITNGQGSIAIDGNVTWLRSNITATPPIVWTQATGIITHATSGVSATGYGAASQVPVFVVDVYGHLTSVTNTSIAIAASQITSGTLLVARGGTGQTAITVNGSLLIGNTVSGGFDVNALTPGTGITVTNDKGSVTISSSDAFAQAQANAAFARANAAYANANTALYTAGQIRANLSNTAPINYDPNAGIFSHALSGATASGYGDAATVPKIIVDNKGHVTSITNTTISIATTQITSGPLNVTALTANTITSNLINIVIPTNNLVNWSQDFSKLAVWYQAGTGTANISGIAPDGTTTACVLNDTDPTKDNGYWTQNIPVANDSSSYVYSLYVKGGTSSNSGFIVFFQNGIPPTIPTPSFNINWTGGVPTDDGTGTGLNRTITAVGNGWYRISFVGQNNSTGNTVLLFRIYAAGQWGSSNTTGSIYVWGAQLELNSFPTTYKPNPFPLFRGGTWQTAITVNGSILIGNTVSGGYDVNTITPGTNMTVTNDKGSITLSSSDAFAQAQANAAFNKANSAVQTGFPTISVSETNTTPVPNNVIASGNSNTLTLIAGTGMTLATDNINNSVSFASGYTPLTNLLVWSQDFTKPVWDGSIYATISGTAPDGTLTACLITDSSNAFDQIQTSQNQSCANDSAIYTYSLYIKAGTALQSRFAFYCVGGTTTTNDMYVNWSGGVPTDSGTGFASLRTITSVGNGWYRVTFRGNNNSSGNTTRIFRIYPAGPAANTTGTIYAWGAQLEFGAIPTTYASSALPPGRGGTGQTAPTFNGSLLIANTVSGGYDMNPLTAGAGVTVTNDKGSITIAATGSSTNAFSTVNVSTSGQSNIIASGATTLVLVPGTGIALTTDPPNNKVTIATSTKGTSLTVNPYMAATANAQAHGLGAMPTFVTFYLENITSEAGFATGERVNMLPSTGTFGGFVVGSNSTHVYSSSNTALPGVIHKTTGALVVITAANWKLVATPFLIN
jgi:hypothetical protein